MRRALAVLCVLAGVGLAKAPDDPAAGALTRLRRAAGCTGKAATSPWCVTAGWRDGTPAVLPVGRVLVGLTVEVRDGAAASRALGDVIFSALAISSDGGDVKADWIVTRGAGDDTNDKAIAALSPVFAGKASVATLPPELAGHLGSGNEADVVRAEGSSWTWTDLGGNAYQLRKVGAFWVLAVKVSPAARNSGQRHPIAIFTDAWK